MSEAVIKPITITDKNNVYVLEFSRESVVFAEQRGWEWDDALRYPATKLKELFFFAMRMHHPKMAKANTDELYDKMGGITPAMVSRLKDLYELCLTSLIRDDEEAPKNGIVVEL